MPTLIHLNASLARKIAMKGLGDFESAQEFVIVADMRLVAKDMNPNNPDNWIQWNKQELVLLQAASKVMYVEIGDVGKYFYIESEANPNNYKRPGSSYTCSIQMPTHEFNESGTFKPLNSTAFAPEKQEVSDASISVALDQIQIGQDQILTKLAQIEKLVYTPKPAKKKNPNEQGMPPFMYFKDVIIGSVFYDHFGQKFTKYNKGQAKSASHADLVECMPNKKVYETRPKQ